MENISEKDKAMYNRILGKLNLPDISEYQEINHILHEVYVRIIEISSLNRQISKLLGN